MAGAATLEDRTRFLEGEDIAVAGFIINGPVEG